VKAAFECRMRDFRLDVRRGRNCKGVEAIRVEHVERFNHAHAHQFPPETRVTP